MKSVSIVLAFCIVLLGCGEEKKQKRKRFDFHSSYDATVKVADDQDTMMKTPWKGTLHLLDDPDKPATISNKEDHSIRVEFYKKGNMRVINLDDNTILDGEIVLDAPKLGFNVQISNNLKIAKSGENLTLFYKLSKEALLIGNSDLMLELSKVTE